MIFLMNCDFFVVECRFADSHPSRTNEKKLTQVNANGTLVDLVRHDEKRKRSGGQREEDERKNTFREQTHTNRGEVASDNRMCRTKIFELFGGGAIKGKSGGKKSKISSPTVYPSWLHMFGR